MHRDYAQFPYDENGNTLWQMYRDGDDFSQPHELEFLLTFNDQTTAERCALALLREAQKLSLIVNPDIATEWLLTIYIDLYPNYHDIIQLEQWMLDFAPRADACYQGWSCMTYVLDDEVDGYS